MKKIILPGDHYHKGVKYQAGDEIELEDDQYEWLVQAIGIQRASDREDIKNIKKKKIGTQEWCDDLLEKEKKIKELK